MTYLISITDVIEEISKGVWNVHELIDRIKALPSADADGDDLIIKGAKGIQDGLYNIKDGKLFKYKAKGGTVRTYPIVPSADATMGDYPNDLISRSALMEYCSNQKSKRIDNNDIARFPSADAVSREWYDDAVKAKHELAFTDLPDIPRYYYEKVVGKMAHEINMLKEQLESADAVQGEWVYIDNYFRVATCSRCHKVTMFEKWGAHTKPFNYCPKCGAKMKGGDSE
jgi:hypothetical protein